MFSRNTLPYSFHARRRRRRPRHHGKPESHRNMASAFFGLVVTGLFALSMAEPNWFRLTGGLCNGKHLGMYPIFGLKMQHLSNTCLNESILLKLRICFSLCLLGIISSMFQFGLDFCGSNRRGLRCMRKNSIGNIISVFVVVTIMGLCYWVTVDITKLRMTGYKPEVTCSLDVAFYLVAGAGISAIIAVTLSLLDITCERRERSRQHGSDMQLQLINNGDLVVELPSLPPPVYQP